jgi:osomolarity two-component system sensor histidine kinase NIK1
MKILVVEDNPLNQKILLYYLTKEEIQARIVSTGEECVEIYKNEWFPVLLMDLMLPGISGFETTRIIRDIEKDKYNSRKTYIIALTANTLDNDRQKCIQNGMDEYIAKPFDIKKLRIIIENLNII